MATKGYYQGWLDALGKADVHSKDKVKHIFVMFSMVREERYKPFLLALARHQALEKQKAREQKAKESIDGATNPKGAEKKDAEKDEQDTDGEVDKIQEAVQNLIV